jgi:HAMP domain-containing protein
VRRPQVDRAELARVLAALGRLGSNVNQLARAANTGEIPARDELADAAVATREMRDALMRALGRGD